MLILEFVSGLKFGVFVMQNVYKFINKVKDLLAVIMLANPDNQALNLIQWLSPTMTSKGGRDGFKHLLVEYTGIKNKYY